MAASIVSDTPHLPLEDEIVIRSIKMLDIGYITAIYVILGMAVALILDRVFGKYDIAKAEKRPFWMLLVEAICHIWLIGVLSYIARNLVELIPFPLDGINGFKHSKVKELTSGGVFLFVLMFYSQNLQERLRYLYARAQLTFVKPKTST